MPWPSGRPFCELAFHRQHWQRTFCNSGCMVLHVPLVVTTGQQDRRHLLAEPFLTSHAVETVRPYVKWAYEPLRAEDVPGCDCAWLLLCDAATHGTGFHFHPDGRLDSRVPAGGGAQSEPRRFRRIRRRSTRSCMRWIPAEIPRWSPVLRSKRTADGMKSRAGRAPQCGCVPGPDSAALDISAQPPVVSRRSVACPAAARRSVGGT